MSLTPPPCHPVCLTSSKVLFWFCFWSALWPPHSWHPAQSFSFSIHVSAHLTLLGFLFFCSNCKRTAGALQCWWEGSCLFVFLADLFWVKSSFFFFKVFYSWDVQRVVFNTNNEFSVRVSYSIKVLFVSSTVTTNQTEAACSHLTWQKRNCSEGRLSGDIMGSAGDEGPDFTQVTFHIMSVINHLLSFLFFCWGGCFCTSMYSLRGLEHLKRQEHKLVLLLFFMSTSVSMKIPLFI